MLSFQYHFQHIYWTALSNSLGDSDSYLSHWIIDAHHWKCQTFIFLVTVHKNLCNKNLSNEKFKDGGNPQDGWKCKKGHSAIKKISATKKHNKKYTTVISKELAPLQVHVNV